MGTTKWAAVGYLLCWASLGKGCDVKQGQLPLVLGLGSFTECHDVSRDWPPHVPGLCLLRWRYVPSQRWLWLMPGLGPSDGSYNASWRLVLLVPSLGHLARGIGCSKACCCLFGICGPIRDYKKALVWAKASHLGRKAARRGLAVLEWGTVSENHQSRANCASQIWHCLLQVAWVQRTLNKGTIAPACTSVPREVSPEHCPSQPLPWN